MEREEDTVVSARAAALNSWESRNYCSNPGAVELLCCRGRNLPTLRRHMKKVFTSALLIAAASIPAAVAQQRVFDWVADTNEVVRLAPGMRQNAHQYGPGQGGDIKLQLTAQRPVTVAMIHSTDWNHATHDPEAMLRAEVMDKLQYLCKQEHVVNTTYTCTLPASADSMALIVRDERTGDRAVLAGISNVLGVRQAAAVIAPANEVSLQYYRWGCVQNCYRSEFQGFRLAKEKFAPNILKTYSLPLPEHDGEQVDVKMKSSVPMLLAVVPSDVAQQLYSHPDMLDNAVGNGVCQQRAAQSVNFGCQLNPNGAAQSLIVLPEPSAGIPKKGKTEIEVTSVKCVAHCRVWTAN